MTFSKIHMERTNKPKNLLLKFLPKAASAVSFQNPTFSPGREHRHHHHHSSTKLKSHAYKGFSGPINFALLPDEARGKSKNNDRSNFETQEPTSPKVSCMGQIKHKHKQKKKKLMMMASGSTTFADDADRLHKQNKCNKQVKKSSFAIGKFFLRSPKTKGSSSSFNDKDGKQHAQDGDDTNHMVPRLGQMKKYASGRETLANFDWRAQITPLDHDQRDCFSDEERERSTVCTDDEEEDREVIIPHSAPILVGGRGLGYDLEPRKEINLWKRRTLAPPPPLLL